MTIQELKEYFNNADVPETIELEKAVTIINVPFFLENSFTILEAGPTTAAYRGCYDRLVKLAEVLEYENN